MATTVGPLAIPMVQPTLRASLMATVGGPPLNSPLTLATWGSAVALAVVARAADPEHHPAALGAATPL